MSGHSDGMDDGRLDLVPMIDCIMLLLLFFMMTTKFSSEEKTISNLMPTDKGAASKSTSEHLDPPQLINIAIYPEGMGPGYSPAEYQTQLAAFNTPIIPAAQLRIGGRAPVLIRGHVLKRKKDAETTAELELIHQYIKEQLQQFEKEGQPRNKQNDIIIHCFSGLSWKYALVTYDAVRSYEGEKNGMAWTGNPEELANARSVTFASPRVRDYAANELGTELKEIIQMK